MKNRLDAIMKEWERSLLGGMCLIVLVGLGLGTTTYLSYLDELEQPPPPKVNVTEEFHADALKFLRNEPPPRLGNNHAMRLQVPRDWIENMEFKAFLAKRERDNKAREAERLRQIALEEQRKRLLTQQQQQNQDPNGGDESKKPPKPITHQLVFKGFMRSPSGEMLAYLGFENVQGEERSRAGTTFIQPGMVVAGYTVQEVQDEFITLTAPDGQKVTVIRGQRITIGKTENPGDAGEEGKPETKPNTRALPKGVSPQMIREYQEFLKRSGGKVDKNTIREFMKQKGFKESDVEKLFRGEKM